MNKAFSSISHDLKQVIKCPKWRKLFESNVGKQEVNYGWKFNASAVWDNIKGNNPSSLVGWNTNVGLYPGRSLFLFPDNSRYVYLNTNTLPMMNVCPKLKGFNEDIFSVQGDESVQNHWIYDREDDINPYAHRIAHFLRHYDGVHTLLQSRE